MRKQAMESVNSDWRRSGRTYPLAETTMSLNLLLGCVVTVGLVSCTSSSYHFGISNILYRLSNQQSTLVYDTCESFGFLWSYWCSMRCILALTIGFDTIIRIRHCEKWPAPTKNFEPEGSDGTEVIDS
jgi:hypothetical protein